VPFYHELIVKTDACRSSGRPWFNDDCHHKSDDSCAIIARKCVLWVRDGSMFVFDARRAKVSSHSWRHRIGVSCGVKSSTPLVLCENCQQRDV